MWTLELDKSREWPVGRTVTSIQFRDPTLADMRDQKDVEKRRIYPDKSVSYDIDWEALTGWLLALVSDKADTGLIGMLSPHEAERAKDRLISFSEPVTPAKPETPVNASSASPTISASAPSAQRTSIE